MKHTMKKLLIPFLLLISTLGFSQGETKIPLLQLYQSGATTGQVPKWDGTKWAAATDVGTLSGTTDRVAVFTSSSAIGASNIISNSNGVAINAGGSSTGNFIIQGVSVSSIAGRSNTGLGYGVFGTASISTCDQNVAIGSPALGAITSGDFNVAIGYSALLVDTSGSSNAAIGYETLKRNLSGSNNLAIGSGALAYIVSTSDNVGVGGYAANNVTGTGNVVIGGQALRSAGGAANVSYTVAIGNASGGQYSTVTGSNNVYIGGFSGAAMAAGANNVFLGYQTGNGASFAALSNRLIIDNSNTTSPMLSGDMNLNMVGINKDITGTLGATLDIKSNNTAFANKALNIADSGGSVFWDVRDNGNAGFGITAQSANKLAVQQSASGTQVAVLIKNGVDEDGQGIALDLNNAGIVHGRIVATNPTGSLTSALDLMTPDNSGTLSSFVTMQRDGSQLQLHKALYKDIYSATSATETLTGLISVVNVPTTSSTTTINLPEIVTGVPASNQVNVGYVLDLVIDNAAAVTVQRSGSSDVIIVDLGVATVTSFASTGGVYLCKKLIAVESNKWVVF